MAAVGENGLALQFAPKLQDDEAGGLEMDLIDLVFVTWGSCFLILNMFSRKLFVLLFFNVFCIFFSGKTLSLKFGGLWGDSIGLKVR